MNLLATQPLSGIPPDPKNIGLKPSLYRAGLLPVEVEVKRAIHEVELKPGAEAEWVFIPLKPGTYSLRCPIAGHTEAGMTGEIAIANQ